MKKRVLLICNNGLEKGGIQAVIMSIVRNLHLDYEFHCVVFKKENEYYSEEFKKYGVIHYFNQFAGNSIVGKLFEDVINYKLYIKQLNKLLSEEESYDVIHCHNYFMAAPFLKVAKKFGIKIRISHSHNVAPPYHRKNPIHNLMTLKLKSMIHKYATHRVACSKAAGGYLFGKDAVSVIYNAIDLDIFNPSKYNILNETYPSFVHVGSYTIQKNQLFLLDVFSEYLKLDNSARLTLVGKGPLEEEVKKKAENLHLNNNIIFLPSDSNIPEVLSKTNIMIFPSTYEGLGISLIEAQAMGIRCYVSENIQPEANLGLCEMLNLSWGAKKWAIYIYNDIQKRGLSREFVDVSSYDIKIVCNKYSEIYSGN